MKDPKTQSGQRFICRECRKKRDRVTEGTQDKRMCVYCWNKMHPDQPGIPGVQPVPQTNPVARAASTPPKHKRTITPYEDAEILASIETPEFQLDMSLRNRITLTHEREILDLRITAIDGAVKEFFTRNDIEAVKYEDHMFERITSSRTSVKVELLLAKGVSAEVIAACTETTEFHVFRMMKPKKKSV